MSQSLLPRITVITPSYNQAPFLEATIRSVLDQDYPNLQYSVVDGNSTDGSAEIIERYRDQVDFAIIEPDRGQVDAINKGLARADGEIICYLNSDDTFLPGTLHAVGEHFHDFDDCDWLMGNCVFIDAMGDPCADPKSGEMRMDVVPIDGLRHALIRDTYFQMPQPSIFWRRALTEKHGLFDESLRYCFDYEMWCRFLAAGHSVQITDRDLATYRLHDQSMTVSSQEGFLLNHIEIERRYAHHLPLKDKLHLYRDIGYRQRQHLVMTATKRPWKQLAKHPWWIASEQVTELMLFGASRKKVA